MADEANTGSLSLDSLKGFASAMMDDPRSSWASALVGNSALLESIKAQAEKEKTISSSSAAGSTGDSFCGIPISTNPNWIWRDSMTTDNAFVIRDSGLTGTGISMIGISPLPAIEWSFLPGVGEPSSPVTPEELAQIEEEREEEEIEPPEPPRICGAGRFDLDVED